MTILFVLSAAFDPSPSQKLFRRPALMNYLSFNPSVPYNEEMVNAVTIPHYCVSPNFDWKDIGVLSPVKDQGGYGCSWAMTAVDAVEAQYSIYSLERSRSLLSPQNLIDHCPYLFPSDPENPIDFPYTCQQAYEWWSRNEVYSSDVYQFVGYKQTPRTFENNHSGVLIFGYRTIPVEKRDHIIIHLNKYPVIACIDCYPSLWKYRAGIIYEGPSKDEYDNLPGIPHAILLVGYGTGKNYWLLKNSWGSGWGDNGYVRINRDIKIGGHFLLKWNICFPYVYGDLKKYDDNIEFSIYDFLRKRLS